MSFPMNSLVRSFISRHAAGLACLWMGMALWGNGCATGNFEQHRVEPYRPEIAGRETWNWRDTDASGPSEDPDDEAKGGLATKNLKRGDRITVSLLTGEPNNEEIVDVVDEQGNITLPLIGDIKVEGLTTAGAEKAIHNFYIEQGYYSKLDVILLSQVSDYFMQGEVRKPGKYPLSGDVTLLEAIADAGGYTEFANPRKVVIRGRETGVAAYDTKRIEEHEDIDPYIQAGDIIRVPKRWY